MAIVLEFTGGFMDGRRSSSDSKNPNEAEWTLAIYNVTQQGTIGGKHKTISDAAFQVLQREGGRAMLARGLQTTHVYEVVNRTEYDGGVVVLLGYVGIHQ